MPSMQYGSIKGLAARATRLDSVGKWATGASAAAVTNNFVSVKWTGEMDSGQEYFVKNADGNVAINEKDRDRLKRLTVEIAFSKVDPEVFELMTGVRLLADYAAENSGFVIAENLPVSPHALEVWSKIPNATGNKRWVYYLIPQLVNGMTFGDITIENGVASFMVKSESQANPNWKNGPYNVVASNVGLTPGVLLSPVAAGEHLYHRATEIAPPTGTTGYVAQTVPWT